MSGLNIDLKRVTRNRSHDIMRYKYTRKISVK